VSVIHPENVASVAVTKTLGETREDSIALNGRQHPVFGSYRPRDEGLR
jgi:hypothetical protein